MAFEKIGLGGFLTFNVNPAVSNMYRARAAMSQFVQGANQVPGSMNRVSSSLDRASGSLSRFTRNATLAKGIGQISSAMGGLGLAMAPLTIGLGLSIRDAMNYEKALAGLDAVVLGTKKELQELADVSFKLAGGAFGASEVVKGMEDMSRAGATAKDIIAGIGGVMAAASAEGIALDKTAEIVGKTAHIMGLGWEDAARVGNILASASAETESKIISLAESFKYGGGASKEAGLSFERTAAYLSRLSDAGLGNSTAGTGFQQVIDGLATPTEAGGKLFKDWNINLQETMDSGGDVIGILEQMRPHLDKMSSLDRQDALVGTFGKRGFRVAAALLTLEAKTKEDAIKSARLMGQDFLDLSYEKQQELLSGNKSIDSLERKYTQASQGIGVASEMAKRKLDSLDGALTMIRHQLEQANIAFFTPFLKPLATLARHFVEFWDPIIKGLKSFRDNTDNAIERWRAMDDVMQSGGSTSLSIMLGINDAIEDMGKAFDWAEKKFNELTGAVEDSLGGDGIRTMTRFALMFGVIGGVMSPVLIGLAGMALVMKMAVIPAVSGVLTIFTALIGAISGPLLGVIGAVGLAFIAIRRDGESFGGTVSRVFWTLIGAAQILYEDYLEPIIDGFSQTFFPGLESLAPQLNQTAGALRNLFDTLSARFTSMDVDWKSVGRNIGDAFIWGFSIALELIQIITEDIDYLIKKIDKFASFHPLVAAYNAVSGISGAIKEHKDKVNAIDAARDPSNAFDGKKDVAAFKETTFGKVIGFFAEDVPNAIEKSANKIKENQEIYDQARAGERNGTLQSGDNISSGPLSSVLTSLGLMSKASANSNGANGDMPIGPGFSKKDPDSKETRYDPFIAEAAKLNNLPEALIKAVIKQESNFNPNAQSGRGAQGLMQMMPGTAAEMGVKDSFDPRQNIMGGSKYLRRLSDKWGGDMVKTIASYNAGPGNVQKHGGIPPFKETQRYVKGVTRNFANYGGEAAQSVSPEMDASLGFSAAPEPREQPVMSLSAPQSSPAESPTSLSYSALNSSLPLEDAQKSLTRATEALTSRPDQEQSASTTAKLYSQMSREEQKKLPFWKRAEMRSAETKEGLSLTSSPQELEQKRQIAELNAAKKQMQERENNITNNITVKASDVNVATTLNVDGKTLAKTVQSHKDEVAERAGFRNTPWERRIKQAHGASRLSR